MILDITNCFTAPAGVLTPFAPTAIGNNINTTPYIDRIVPMDDGAGQPISAIVYVTTSVTSAGAPTVDFQIIGNNNDPTFTAGNVVVADADASFLKATLVAGFQVSMALNRRPFLEYLALGTPLRYLALNVVIGTAVLTAGAFNAWLVTNQQIQGNQSYPSGFAP